MENLEAFCGKRCLAHSDLVDSDVSGLDGGSDSCVLKRLM